MNFIGIDLPKKTSSLCVVNQQRKVLQRKQLLCAETERIVQFFQQLQPFQAVVEAIASYEWLWLLLEPLAERLVLAHPKKLRVIAESSRKTDKRDAQVLAEFLALDMIPRAYRPTPRQRQHRNLIRQRYYRRQRTTAAKNKIRRLLSNYNADRKELFSAEGLARLKQRTLTPSDRLILRQLLAEWRWHEKQGQALDKALVAFAKKGPVAEQEARAALGSIPEVGPVTIEVVLSELGDVSRFRCAKRVSACAGLAPGQRASAGKSKELGIPKEGSRLLRWVLVEAAWRLVGKSRRWGAIYERLQQKRGKKKAIVAVARRLSGVMVALLRSGQRYRPEAEAVPA